MSVPTAVPRLWRTRALRRAGLTARQIADGVRDGRLLRPRRGAYCGADTDPDCVRAAQLRGRLTCVSELRRRGVFVLARGDLHVHIDRTAARLDTNPPGVLVHRRRLRRVPGPDGLCVEPVDAVIDAVRCQDPRSAIATLDSALHLGVLHDDDLDEVFDALPRRFRRLRPLLDARAESGPESLMRLLLRAIGRPFEVQVRIDGVGRVDFLVDGWLIVECDSREFHSSWEAQRADLRRDLAAAERGYLTMRFIAEDILWHPDRVSAALRGILVRRRMVSSAG